MLVYVRHTWAWTAAGTGLATALFAAYVAFRIRHAEPAPSSWELLAVLACVSLTIPLLTSWLAQLQGQAFLQQLTQAVASLRENPSLAGLRTLSPELSPLYDELEQLGQTY